MNEKSLYSPVGVGEDETDTCLAVDDTSLQSIIHTQQARLRTAKLIITFLTVLYIGSAFAMYMVVPGLHGSQTDANTFRIDPIHGQIPLIPVVFQSNDTFVEQNPMTHNGVWSEILAAKSAIVPVPHAQALGLSGGMPPSNGSEYEGFGTSMFHQLHCLSKIKVELMYVWEHVGEEHLATHLVDAQWHMNHCVEYLRQAIMCTGDLTPEKALVDGDYYNGPTPWGAEHTCVDFQAVRNGIMDNLFKGYLYLPVDEAKRPAYFEQREHLGKGAFRPPE